MPHSASRVRASLLALALGGFAIGTTEFASMGVLPDIASDLGETIPSTGTAISAYALGVVVGAPLFAMVGARMPRKGLLVLLMTGITLGNLWSAAATSFPAFVAARFAAGLPHGAYFGIAAVVAASFVPADRRGRAIAFVMAGLTVANVAGVPLSTFLGQQLGWRSTYWVVTVIGAATVLAIALVVPHVPRSHDAGVATELHALGRLQVWLSLAVVAIGFGGIFAVYSYVSPTMTEVAGMGESAVPIVLGLFGLGMTLGNLAGGRLSDRSMNGTIVGGMLVLLAVLVTYPLAARTPVTAGAAIFLIGAAGSSILPALTTRVLDAAGPAQSLAAALIHSAFNAANALGAWIGAVVIAAGLGYTAPALAGAGLAVAGLGVMAVAVVTARRTPATPFDDDVRLDLAAAVR